MKKLLFSGMIALTAGAGFTGCSKSTDLYDEGAVQALKDQQVINLRNAYSDAFVQQYGNIASNQAWGFEKTKTTHGVTRTVVNDASNLKTYAMPTNAAALKNYNNFNKYGKAICQKFANAKSTDFMTVQDLLDKGVKLENYYLQHIYKSTANGNSSGKGKTGLEIDGDYYIGFDYTNVWNKKEYDFNGDFTEWIIRIAKAEPLSGIIPSAPIQARIFCEDMGSLGDFDFNDVVFDAIVQDNGDIDITVLANGATFDITDQDLTNN